MMKGKMVGCEDKEDEMDEKMISPSKKKKARLIAILSGTIKKPKK